MPYNAKFHRSAVFAAAWCVMASAAAAPVSTVDDAGRTITLRAPAKRIVSLAPHATELLFAAGAGKRVVGVSEYSNYPPQALKIASVGGASSLDIERIIALKPDLVVSWTSGSPAAQVEKLKAVGIAVFESEPRSIEAIATSIDRLARLAGTDAAGQKSSSDFLARMATLESEYGHRRPVRVFYQIWNDPLMTLNGDHLASAMIKRCGGENIFAALPQLTPSLEDSAVIKANPEVIISGDKGRLDTLIQWKRFKKMAAVARGNLYTVDADLVARPGPRVADGMEAICQRIDEARQKRK